MEFTATESLKLSAIAAKHSTNMPAAIAAAYEEGILEGAMRAARAIGLQQATAAPTAPTGGDGDDDEPLTSLTEAEKAAIRAHGIDPNKPFRSRTTMFTIVGWKPSRWKFPISAINARGTRYKFPIDSVKFGQR